MTVMVDSDILIEVSRGRNEIIVAQWLDLSNTAATVLYSPVSAAELWAGARPGEHELLEGLFNGLTRTEIDHEIGQLAGAYLRRFHRSHGLDLGDALIAAGAVTRRAELWTRNHKHYPMDGIAFFAA
jgi:hypothetical protein